ncbi:ABC transporter substrate-binding protein, partial [Streptomyces sp. NRRL F-6602]
GAVARGVSGSSPIPYKVAFILDVAGENEALVARKGTGITTVAGLKGKKVATPFASTSHYSLLAALEEAGLKASDVELLDLQPQPILAAWERGDIDAAYVWLPTLDELRETGTQLTSSKEIGEGG